jgi:hypothetical protein
VARIPNSKILGFQTWESWGKWYLGATLVTNHKKYYMGKGCDFPQVQGVVNLVSPCMLVAHLCTKNVSTMH